jgi:hypothetical protein
MLSVNLLEVRITYRIRKGVKDSKLFLDTLATRSNQIFAQFYLARRSL